MAFRGRSSMHPVSVPSIYTENANCRESSKTQPSKYFILFTTLAIELKRRAPSPHPFLEVIHARYGTTVHIVFIIVCLMTNILVTTMLLTGSSAVLSSLTDVNIVAACFLLPIGVGVVLYTLFGGIKVTFITDYMHTVVVLMVIFLFAFSAYATNATLGSPGKVYDTVVAASSMHPVEGNAQGSWELFDDAVQGERDFLAVPCSGHVAALFSPVIISPILTYTLGSQNYDYQTMQSIRQVDDHSPSPPPMYASSGVFSRPFFTGWVVVGILWLFVTMSGDVVVSREGEGWG